MTTEYLCPACGHDEWSCWRTHTVYEEIKVSNVLPDGMYNENDSNFGDTEDTSDFYEIQCNACGEPAPANHPLWPTKEKTNE